VDERSEKIRHDDETDTAILNEWRLQALLELSEMAEASIREIALFAMEEGIRLTRSKIGYIAFTEQDETIFKMYAWSQSAMKECSVVDKPLVYSLEKMGLWGEAVRQRRPIITNDYQAANHWKKGYPPGHVEVIRHMNVPVFDGERIVAVAGVGNKEEPYYETDVRHLKLLMDGVWRIISCKRTHQAMERMNRALRILSSCNQLLTRAGKEADFLRDSCRVLIEEGGYHLAWMGFATAETEEALCPAVEAGFEEKGLEVAELTWSGTATNCELLQTVIRTGRPTVWRAGEGGEEDGPWKSESDRLGYASFIALPLMTDAEVMGVLVVYSAEPDSFDDEEVTLLKDLTNNLAYGVVSLRSRLEREQAEARIRELNADLEQRVVERTRQLESFSYSVAHDLRTPLRGISGFAQILLDDYHEILGEAGREYLHRIQNGIDRMDLLINNLLELSRITRSKVVIEEVDLSAIVKKITENLKQAEPHRKVEVIVQPEVVVQGDRRLLTVALENLLGNAWKFTHHRSTARIEFGTTNISGRTACFVRDNGVGFDMAYASKLFSPFERLHLQSEFEGTGIGLTIVKRIIDHHRGQIWAEGEAGKGAKFYFTLPRR
jgi:signal transduction histidine kinase